MMEDVLQGLNFAIVYMDDVVIFFKNMEVHISHYEEVFGKI